MLKDRKSSVLYCKSPADVNAQRGLWGAEFGGIGVEGG